MFFTYVKMYDDHESFSNSLFAFYIAHLRKRNIGKNLIYT